MKWSVEKKVVTGVGIALVVLLVNALISYHATRTLIDEERWVANSHMVLAELEATLYAVTDAEAGVRGFIITKDESYLEPYQAAVNQIPQHLERLRQLTADNANQQARIPVLEGKIAARMERLKFGMDQRRTSAEGARQSTSSGVGKLLMDSVRQHVDLMENEEHDLLSRRSEKARASGRHAFLTDVIPNVLACVLLLLGAVLVFRDLTERRNAAQARSVLAAIVESSQDAIISKDLDGTILSWNAGAERIFGYSSSEAVGQSIMLIIPPERRGEEKFILERLCRGEGVEHFETVRVSKNGRLINISLTISPLRDTTGRIIGASKIARDITERKRTEEALRQQREWFQTTLSSIGDAVIATDIHGAITFLNPVAQSLTGWKQEEAENQPLLEVFKIANEQTRKPVENPALSAMEQGAVVGMTNQTVLTARDGTEIPIDDSGAPIKDSEGNLLGAVLIFRDIAERKRAEQDRIQLLASERAARERAEVASRAKDEFVAMVSHEIRSPLNAILGWAQIVRTGKLDEQQTARAIETIERNAKNQAKLVEDLLDISRAISGKLRLTVRPVDAAQIMETAIDSIRPAAEAKSIQLLLHRSPRACLVSADPDRLQQVVWNLLSNAVKFTPRGGRVEVRLERVDANLQITVSDSGAGISPEFLPYVFDRFSQANMTTERRHGGLGLGLAIVRHLVELHGGAVRAESAGDGQGATFTVTLPVNVVSGRGHESDPTGTAASAFALGDSVMLDGLRVMIVDDEAETRDLLSAILTQRGAEVRPCASAAEAFQAIREWQPAVIVSDIGMPGEDGFALIKKLRMLESERGGNVPAVALTAYARSEDRTRVLAAGFQMHVAKPVEALELIMVIASLAGRQAMKA
ncbi:MAG TPA: PAS domain S-box protein [Blastocatellia bacterium]|nr:PAS domain S-box protein [Blastocatellia bacterium]